MNNEIKEIVDLWRTTTLLKGLEPSTQESCALCMESQRQRNDYSDNFTQFNRISIPIVRRVFSAEALREHNVELLGRLEANAYNWKWIALGAPQETNSLEQDAELTFELANTCTELLVDKAKEQSASKLYFGGIHLEQDMIYALYDFGE